MSKVSLNVLDLYSGFGGASEAFLEAGDHVLRIENNPLLSSVPATTMMDVQELEDFLYEHARRDGIPIKPDLIWASPPCLEFSQAYDAPGPRARRAGIEFEPDMRLVESAITIIEILQPKWWVIENVRGAIPHFADRLGEPRQNVGPFVLWGRFPELRLSKDFQHRKADHDKRHSPLRSNHRARIPLEVSQALRTAILTQRQII